MGRSAHAKQAQMRYHKRESVFLRGAGSCESVPEAVSEVIVMQKVLLLMHRKFVAQTLINSMENDSRFEFFPEYSARNAAVAALSFRPDIAVVEIPESESGRAAEYLAVCAEIRAAAPGCRLLLFCSEASPDSKNAAVAAARAGEIDDFVFFDTSWEYLVSKLELLSSR